MNQRPPGYERVWEDHIRLYTTVNNCILGHFSPNFAKFQQKTAYRTISNSTIFIKFFSKTSGLWVKNSPSVLPGLTRKYEKTGGFMKN